MEQDTLSGFVCTTRIHDTVECAELCCTTVADATPNMEFDGVFWAWFIAGFLILTLFPAAEPPVCFELHCSFVRPHNVVMKIFSSPPVALLFVLLSNQLAVGCLTRCPTKQLSSFQHSAERYSISKFGSNQQSKLFHCSFIVTLHFLFDWF